MRVDARISQNFSINPKRVTLRECNDARSEVNFVNVKRVKNAHFAKLQVKLHRARFVVRSEASHEKFYPEKRAKESTQREKERERERERMQISRINIFSSASRRFSSAHVSSFDRARKNYRREVTNCRGFEGSSSVLEEPVTRITPQPQWRTNHGE